MSFERTLIIGNGGTGKTWLSSRLGPPLGLPVIHLDDIHWQPGRYGVGRDKAEVDEEVRLAAEAQTWLMEGVYGWLANIVLPRASTLVWIDLPEAECVANIQARGQQGGGTAENFRELLKWVSEYRQRTKNWNSWEAHAKLFQGHQGIKVLLKSRSDIAAFLDEAIGRRSSKDA